MSEPLAEASVKIRPDLTGFVTELQTGLTAVTRKVVVPVKIVPDLTGFTTELRTAIRAISVLPGTYVTVPVRPDLKGFKAALRTETRALGPLLAGTAVKVPIVPVAPTGAAAAAGAPAATAAARGVTTATTAAAAGERALAVETRRTTTALKEQGRVASAIRGLNIGVGATSSGPAAVAAARANRGLNNVLKEQNEIVSASAIRTERFARGVTATALSQVGLRGATLAATSAFLAGAAAITAFSKAVGLAVGFQRQLSVFAATTGASAQELQKVRAAALALGKDLTLPGVSASDAAEAMTELAKAGLSVQDSIAGARGVLQLGTAANISFAEATTLAANAINAFNLSGGDATHVADVLANAANAAQGSIVDIGTAFGQAAAVGHQVGLSFEDTTVFLTALARAGLTSSDAGTSLRTALIRLINPSKKAQEIFKSLGLTIRDAEGNLRPEFFTNLGIAIQGMSAKQRDATLAQIGGQDAIRALSILSKLAVPDLINLRTELEKQGTAADVAAARNVGLAGAAANFQNTIENIAIGLGSKATPALASFTDSLTATVQAIADSPLVTGALSDAVSAVGDSFHVLGSAIAGVTPLLAPLAASLNTVVSAIGGANIAAAVGAFVLLRKSIAGIGAQRAFASLKEAEIAGASNAFTTLGATALVAGDRIKFVARDLLAMTTSLTLLRVGLAEAGTAFLGFATSTLGITLGLAALAGGLFFVLTRESELDKATKRFQKTTDNLAGSLRKLADAEQSRASAQSVVNTAKAAADQAKLAAATAQTALANSNAAAGTVERTQLESRLAISLQDVITKERKLVDARNDLKTATELLHVAEQNRATFGRTEASRLIDVLEKANSLKELGGPTAGIHQIEEQRIAHLTLLKVIQQEADELRREGSAESIDLAKRLDALKLIANRVKDLPTTIRLLFNAKSVERGLEQVRHNLINTGQPSAAGFVKAYEKGLNSGLITAADRASPAFVRALQVGLKQALAGVPFSFLFDGIVAAAAAAGEDSAQALFHPVQVVLNAIAALTGKQNQALLQQQQAFGVKAAAASQRGVEAQLADDQGAQLRAAQEEERSLNKQLEIAKKRARRGKGKLEDLRRLEQDALAAKQKREGIEADIAAESKRKSDERAQKAKDAQQARDDADRAFLDLIGASQDSAQLQVLRAGATRSLADDIAAEQHLQTLLLKQIAQSKTTIKDVHQRAQTVASLTSQVEQTTQTLIGLRVSAVKQRFETRLSLAQQTESLDDDIRANEALAAAYRTAIASAKKSIKNERERRLTIAAYRVELDQTNATIKELNAQREKQRQEQFQTSLDLDVAFAQTKKNISAEIKAHQAEIRYWTNIKNHAKRGSVEYKEARNRIAENQAAIADLRKATKDRNDEFRSLTFEFLQAQQGFASTILSNLLPSGSVAGSVGGGAISTPTGGGALPSVSVPSADFATAAHRRPRGLGLAEGADVGVAAGTGLSRAAQTTGVSVGATAGQMSTLILLMRQLVSIVGGHNQRQKHPEAAIHQSATSAAMSTIGW